jgi:hypothetical protein
MTTGKVSFQTVEYMQRLISELDEANTQLKLEAESIAADERAKIVAWLRAQNRLASLDLEKILANEIEAGEHLK